MRRRAILLAVLTLCGRALSRDRQPAPAPPGRFEIGRHTFFDFGPPNDFYELFLVRPTADDASSSWKFPKDAAGQQIHAAIEFASNCPSKRP